MGILRVTACRLACGAIFLLQIPEDRAVPQKLTHSRTNCRWAQGPGLRNEARPGDSLTGKPGPSLRKEVMPPCTALTASGCSDRSSEGRGHRGRHGKRFPGHTVPRWSSVWVTIASVGGRRVRPDFLHPRTLRVYSTQKKRVAFNVSKMLAGAGAEGEVGELGSAWGRAPWGRRRV